MQVDVTSQLRPQCLLHTSVYDLEATEQSYIQCEPFSEQEKSLRHLQVEDWNMLLLHESSKHKQVMFPYKASHTAAHLGADNVTVSSDGINRFNLLKPTPYLHQQV